MNRFSLNFSASDRAPSKIHVCEDVRTSVLAEDECREHLRRTTDFYGGFLAESLFQFKEGILGFSAPRAARGGLRFLEHRTPQVRCLEILDTIFNPKRTVGEFSAW